MSRLLASLVPLTLVELIAQMAGYFIKFRYDAYEYVIAARVRGLYWQLHFKSSNLYISRNVFFEGRKNINLDSNVKLHAGVQISALGSAGYVTIGSGSHISRLTTVAGGGGVEIGRDCAIAAHVSIISVSADGHKKVAGAQRIALPVKIGDGAFIGVGSRILPGVTIGNYVTVGAGSVVTKDLPKGSIAYGVPARVHGYKDGYGPKAQVGEI